MKRILLFLLTNFAILAVLNTAIMALGLDRYLASQGLDVGTLLVYSLLVGFSGSLISLALSKSIAKWTTGARVIDGSEGTSEQWLIDTVATLAHRADVAMPEVAIYPGPPNAFATGPSRNHALVAVSTGLLQALDQRTIEAVLAHEITHVSNGDMVTLTLIQGVLNTFIVFISRVVGLAVDRALLRNDDERGVGIGFYVTTLLCELVFGVLATMIVMWFSREREYRADHGSATLIGSARPMIAALEELAFLDAGALPSSLHALGIDDQPAWSRLFSSHPPIDERIAALQAFEQTVQP